MHLFIQFIDASVSQEIGQDSSAVADGLKRFNQLADSVLASYNREPVRVAVTGASGQIGYSLLFRIARYIRTALNFLFLTRYYFGKRFNPAPSQFITLNAISVNINRAANWHFISAVKCSVLTLLSFCTCWSCLKPWTAWRVLSWSWKIVPSLSSTVYVPLCQSLKIFRPLPSMYSHIVLFI